MWNAMRLLRETDEFHPNKSCTHFHVKIIFNDASKRRERDEWWIKKKKNFQFLRMIARDIFARALREVCSYIIMDQERKGGPNICRGGGNISVNWWVLSNRYTFDLMWRGGRKHGSLGGPVATSWAILPGCRAKPSSTMWTEPEATSSSHWSTIRCTCLWSTSNSGRTTIAFSNPGEFQRGDDRFGDTFPFVFRLSTSYDNLKKKRKKETIDVPGGMWSRKTHFSLIMAFILSTVVLE